MRIELPPASAIRAPAGGTAAPAAPFSEHSAAAAPLTTQDRVSLSTLAQPPLPQLATPSAPEAARALVNALINASTNSAAPAQATGAGPASGSLSTAPPGPGAELAPSALSPGVGAGPPLAAAQSVISSPSTAQATSVPAGILSTAGSIRVMASSAFPGATPGLATHASGSVSGQDSARIGAGLQTDTGRLSQPGTTAAQSVQAPTGGICDGAPARIVGALLDALGGDGAALLERLMLTVRDAATLPDNSGDSPVYSAPARPGSGTGSTLLTSLLLQGTTQTADRQSLSYRAALTMDRQALSTLAPALAGLAADSDALKNLALDIRGAVPELAGQQFTYTLSLDPRALWPAQSFILSGWIAMQKPPAARCRAGGETRPEEEDQEGAAPNPGRRRKPPAEAHEAEEIDDGGPPVISGRRWLSFKLRHLYARLRAWLH